MRKLLAASLGLVGGLALVGLAAIVMALLPQAPQYYAGQRKYTLVYDGKQVSMRADRIARQDGCIIFYRHERVDTILCEAGMGTLLVTESFE